MTHEPSTISNAAGREQRAGATLLVVDAHVHIYACHDLRVTLDSAADNLPALVAGATKESSRPLSCLLLTESARDFVFRGLCEGSVAIPEGFAVARRPCPASLLVSRDDGRELLLIAGRQIATAERLEVLAIGRDADVPDGLSIGRTIDSVRDAGAFPVIPWGFGKWLGRRGAIVREVLARESPSRLALGDNGGRLAIGRDPALFTDARALGYRILPGSDPLPFPDQARRVGTYGFALRLAPGAELDAAAVRRALAGLPESPPALGRRTGLTAFVGAQLRMQLKSRF